MKTLLTILFLFLFASGQAQRPMRVPSAGGPEERLFDGPIG